MGECSKWAEWIDNSLHRKVNQRFRSYFYRKNSRIKKTTVNWTADSNHLGPLSSFTHLCWNRRTATGRACMGGDLFLTVTVLWFILVLFSCQNFFPRFGWLNSECKKYWNVFNFVMSFDNMIYLPLCFFKIWFSLILKYIWNFCLF